MRIPPFIRLSVGLIGLTISVLLIGEMLGVVPDKSESAMEARKKLSESLAVQFAVSAKRGDYSQIETVLSFLVERNPDVLSAALREDNGEMIVMAGDHETHWVAPPEGKSTPTHVQIPIFNGDNSWGRVEIRFVPLAGQGLFAQIKNSFWGMLLFVGVSGLLGFMLFMKRALKELDPSAVIPERVKAAFDALAEGVLILDEEEQIVLANKAFGDRIGSDCNSLIGKKASNFGWKKGSLDQLEEGWEYPWNRVLKNGELQVRVRLMLAKDEKQSSIFMVNCTPLMDSGGSRRGVLATFDDLTKVEEQNVELQGMLDELEKSQHSIRRQNDQLKELAELDSLTGCFNRRMLQNELERAFEFARENNEELCCIMVDIDHFKNINDTYGHQAGDKIIQLVAEIITSNLRDKDMVGRYGGEEFCVILPGINKESAFEIAERMRINIMDSSEYRFTSGKRVTASLGVSSVKDEASGSTELVDQADKALYLAKNSGRNLVKTWAETLLRENDSEEDVAGVEATVTEMPIVKGQNVGEEMQRLHVRIKELEGLTDEQCSQLERRMNYDQLTGLPSRFLAYDRLKSALLRARRNKKAVAVLSISTTVYERILDTLGRGAAEQLIVAVAGKLTNVLRESDTVTLASLGDTGPTLSRLDSDGFYLIVPDLNNQSEITRVINRIYEIFDEPLVIEGYKIQVSNNMGVSLYPNDGDTVETLLKHSDIARHHAQSLAGNNNCQFYLSEMNSFYSEQLHLESDLLRGLEYNEFELHYQPRLGASEGSINSFEALLRWNHPDKGIVSAAEFIDVAESSGLILRIGDWVLNSAIEQLAQWHSKYSDDLVISINLSPLQIEQTNLVDNMLECIERHQVPPQCIELEITENSVIENMDNSLEKIQRLYSAGVRIAIDDFGTGYSSLRHIQQFPVNTVKIDRSFVMNLGEDVNDASIVSAVISLSKDLGLVSVAEGVETDKQFKILQKLGCDEIQGYLFSKPVSAVAAEEMLQRQSASDGKSRIWLAS